MWTRFFFILSLLIIILVSCKKEPETPQKPNVPTHTDTIPTPLQFQYGQLGLSDSFRNHFRCKPEWPAKAKIIGKWEFFYGWGMTGATYPSTNFSSNLEITSDSIKINHIRRNNTTLLVDSYTTVESLYTNENILRVNFSNNPNMIYNIYPYHCDSLVMWGLFSTETSYLHYRRVR